MVGQSRQRAVAVVLGEVGVDARVVDFGDGGVEHQLLVHQHVVERLRVAVEDERVALLRRREFAQVDQVGFEQVDAVARHHGLLVRRRRAGDDAHRIDQAVVEGERVEVAQHDQARLRRGLLALVDHRGEVLGLALALEAHALAGGVVEFGIVERALVHRHHADRPGAAVGVVHHGLQQQRRTVVERGQRAVGLLPLQVLADLGDRHDLARGQRPPPTSAFLTRKPTSMPPMSLPSCR